MKLQNLPAAFLSVTTLRVWHVAACFVCVCECVQKEGGGGVEGGGGGGEAVNRAGTYCACCRRQRSVGKVGAREVGDHDERVARVRWALEQTSILPFGR